MARVEFALNNLDEGLKLKGNEMLFIFFKYHDSKKMRTLGKAYIYALPFSRDMHIVCICNA